MARPLTRAQVVENRRFLAALARTGNARMAAREVGRAHASLFHRRAGHPDFAARWDAAMAGAHARFHAGKSGISEEQGTVARNCPRDAGALRTGGGEMMVVRTRSGRLQARRAHAGKLTRVAEQLFLQALSATANVRLAAAAAGASARAFYRRRQRSPAFAREFRMALETGYARLEAGLIESFCAQSHEDDAWRHNDPPPIPPMTAAQALQLLYLHEKSVRQGWELAHRRRRRGESDEVHAARLAAMWASEQARAAEMEAVRRAALAEEKDPFADDMLPPLPALDQVRGWSRADPARAPHDPARALFGGWRIAHMEKKLRRG